MPSRKIPFIALLIVALIVAACGSNSGSGSVSAIPQDPTTISQDPTTIPDTGGGDDQREDADALTADIEIETGVIFELQERQTGRYGDLFITFTQVISESRCPVYADCIVAGQIVVEIEVYYEGQTTTIKLTDMPLNPTDADIFAEIEGVVIEFYSADPYPGMEEQKNQPMTLTLFLTEAGGDDQPDLGELPPDEQRPEEVPGEDEDEQDEQDEVDYANLSGPPTISLQNSDGEMIVGHQGSYCWTPPLDGSNMPGLCVDMIFPPPFDPDIFPITITGGEPAALTFQFSEPLPDSVRLAVYGAFPDELLDEDQTEIDSEIKVFNFSLPAGEYVITLSSFWSDNGDSQMMWQITVE